MWYYNLCLKVCFKSLVIIVKKRMHLQHACNYIVLLFCNILGMVNVALQVVILYWYRRQHRRRRTKKTYWVHEIYKKRNQYGEYNRLVQELQLDHGLFQKYFRMSREQFRIVLSFVEEDITRLDTQLRESIGARQRLALTIR